MSIVDEYYDLKKETNADLLAMQVGDFYEFFGDDAKEAGNKLGLKIAEKSSHGSSHAMAGVPINDIDQYINNLVDKMGYTVAVADQYKENGNHKREIVRTVTPGTILENFGGSPKYLCSIYLRNKNCSVCFTDVTSGQITTTDCEFDEIIKNLSIYNPEEIVISENELNDKADKLIEKINEFLDCRIDKIDYELDYHNSELNIKTHFGQNILETLQIDSKAEVININQIIEYLSEVGHNTEMSITKLRKLGDDKYVNMGASTRRSLEISGTMTYDSGISLFDVMDKTLTNTGSDLLKRFLQRPLTNEDEIQDRQNSVSSLVENAMIRSNIRDILKSSPNLQRIATKSTNKTASPRDIYNIIDGVDCVEDLEKIVSKNDNLKNSSLHNKFQDINTEKIREIYKEIKKSIAENPPNTKQSDMIKYGYNQELDEIVDEYNKHKNWFENLESELSEDITHATVGRNQTDGYYVQVGNTEEDDVPNKFNKIKSLKSSVRFKNEEIKEHENKILRLEEKREKKEKEIFSNIVQKVAQKSNYIQNMGNLIAYTDVIQSLSTHAIKNSWKKPDVSENEDTIDIKNGRHPVVEQTVDFVPNSSVLDDKNRMTIVTGPNMAGKSTYLRQVALITLLSQAGSYVPAEEADIGTVDGIYTRIGSLDEISQGKSTFMVEMSELANILHSSTDNSLVILDEVGRGTATYDGLSIAKSTVEYLTVNDNGPNPKCLFATHYHELTELENDIESINNLHVEVDSDGDDYQFLHNVEDGAADESYGIKVADIAGVPDPVVDRSSELLEELDDDNNQ